MRNNNNNNKLSLVLSREWVRLWKKRSMAYLKGLFRNFTGETEEDNENSPKEELVKCARIDLGIS
jgi:hypothetical protein